MKRILGFLVSLSLLGGSAALAQTTAPATTGTTSTMSASS
jgi:hypothetical protein